MLRYALYSTVLLGVVSPASAMDAGQTANPSDTPAQVAQAIATGCNEKRFSEVGGLLHSSLRRTWIDIGYKVKDYCELITRTYTLVRVRIEKEERAGDHALVYLIYTYRDGSESADRATFLQEKGDWKLLN